MKIPSKIIFAGAVQSAEKHLPAVLRNIENLTKLFSEAGYIFVENDSTDNTKKILQDWGSSKSNFHLINLDGLKAVPIRTIRLEMVRNAYLETIRHYAELRDFDYLAVLDMDDVGGYLIDIQEASSAIEFLDASPTRAAVFANQRGTYGDMWALRHSSKCPGDIWEDVLDYVIKYKCSDEVAFAETFAKRFFSIEESLEPIKVDSAFGGFGIYKMEYVLNNPNPYLGSKTKIVPLDDGTPYYAKWQICEHVHFHAGIKSQGGEMFIYPKLINGVNAGVSIPGSAFRGLIF
jgi:glycosyltransferase involved in cell wall biosynthesis